jgi:hypothetical protein
METEQRVTTMWKPSVPRKYLFAFAGVLWTVAGLILCVRGAGWLRVFGMPAALALEGGGIALGMAGYLYTFSRLVRKNVCRIGQLPERPCAFAFTSWTGYIMIASMMTLGITLRNSSIPLWWLSVPYSAMGTALLAGSLAFYREFFIVSRRRADGT